MSRFIAFAGGFLLSLGVLFAQLQFEVASIRPADIEGHPTDSLYTDHSAGLHVVNFPLREIILFAYDIRDFQLLKGPGWIDAQRYDITAKTGTGAGDSDEQARDRELRERTRSLLTDRFGLAVHHETRDLTGYALTVAKGGPKLKVVTERGTQYGFRGGRGRNQGFAVTMTMFANELARVIGRPVIDKTGLAGEYDYLLEWTPDEAGTLGVTIFTALQEQLGLRLESTKAPVDTVVIDRVDRPTAN